MPELTPRRGPASIAAPSEDELRAANELLRNLEQLAPESMNVSAPEEALPELARALEARTNKR